MTTLTNATIVESEPSVLAGPLRNVINPDIEAGTGSIHDEVTAQKLGFRGGTVAGSYHMNLYPPLAVEAFGKQWFERGSLSLYFRNATLDREPVRAYVRRPVGTEGQVATWIHREDGMLVAEGTLAAGEPIEPTALQRIPLDEIDGAGVRILSAISRGDAIPETGMIISHAEHERRLSSAAEVLEWNLGPSDFGDKPVLTPNSTVGLLYQPCVATIRGKAGRSVGLFGAIELRYVNGPAFEETPYVVHGKVLAVGQSPKTEFFWYETYADDQDGKRIAEMRMLLRFMKASSPLYAEGR